MSRTNNFVVAKAIYTLAVLLCYPAAAFALPMFYGPSSYQSVADRPMGFCSSCNLEDLEDNALDSFLTLSGGQILGPDATGTDGSFWSDSVEHPGHSWFLADTNPVLSIDFAQPVSAAGLAWTDGDRNIQVVLEAFDAEGQSLGMLNAMDLSDDTFFGSKEEDRFLGVRYAGGISRLQISNMGLGNGLEIDHITWQVVPEPSSFWICAVAVPFLIRRRK